MTTDADIKKAMNAVIQSAGDEGMNIVTLFERTMRLLGESGDPQQMALDCGYSLDDRVRAGTNYQPAIRVVGK